jgi:hypothetical protein
MVIVTRAIPLVLLSLSTASCGPERIIYRDLVPYVGKELRAPVAIAPITAQDPAGRAAQGVTNLVLHVDRLEGDRAAVDCILSAAEARAAGDPVPACAGADPT